MAKKTRSFLKKMGGIAEEGDAAENLVREGLPLRLMLLN